MKKNIDIEDIIFKVDTEEKFNLLKVFTLIWNSKIYLVKTGAIFFLIGILISLISPTEYASYSRLFPEYNENTPNSNLLGQFGGLAGLAGIDLGQTGGLNPELYPTIVRSTPYYEALLSHDFYIRQTDDSTSLENYFINVKDDALLEIIIDYTIGLPITIRKILADKGDSNNKRIAGLNYLSEQKLEIISELEKRISCDISKKSGIISISVEMPEAELAASVNKFTKNYITEYLTDYKTRKIEDNLLFLIERRDEAKGVFDLAKINLFKFRDENKNIIASSIRSREQELESEYQLALKIYDNLNQQVEQTKITVKEQIPVFKTLQPPYVPTRKSKPKRILTTVLFTLIGGMIGIGMVIIKNYKQIETK